jgi:hypothetical protein
MEMDFVSKRPGEVHDGGDPPTCMNGWKVYPAGSGPSIGTKQASSKRYDFIIIAHPRNRN